MKWEAQGGSESLYEEEYRKVKSYNSQQIEQEPLWLSWHCWEVESQEMISITHFLSYTSIYANQIKAEV